MKATFLILFLLTSALLMGQQKQTEQPKFGVNVFAQPLFALNNAFKTEVEFNTRNKYLNVVLSPEIYGGQVDEKWSNKGEGTDKLTGFGIGLSNKMNLSTKGGPYLSYGLVYRNLQVNYNDEDYVPYEKDGLQFYEYRQFSDQLKINSVLLNTTLGVQIFALENSMLDFYFGGGYKFSKKSSAFPEQRQYDQRPASFAYNGFLFIAGIKIGFKIM